MATKSNGLTFTILTLLFCFFATAALAQDTLIIGNGSACLDLRRRRRGRPCLAETVPTILHSAPEIVMSDA